MHINYQYLMDFVRRKRQANNGITVLDYGCGAGEVVIAGRKEGVNIFGAEVFYEPANKRTDIEEQGLLGSVVREIRNGRLDFPDAFFDIVLNNQVFEHVEDLDQVLMEINRVLKPGGTLLSLFPSSDVWREGHCGIPFLHWFGKKSSLRYHYALWLRKLGLGHNKDNKSPEQWTEDYLHFLDNFCFYRKRQDIIRSFKRWFEIDFIEDDYIRVRLEAGRLRPLSPLIRYPILRPVGKELFRKLAGMVIVALKPV